jgi:hypothetical protein
MLVLTMVRTCDGCRGNNCEAGRQRLYRFRQVTDTGQKVAPLPTKTVVTEAENQADSVPIASSSKTKVETTIRVPVVPQKASNINLSTEQMHQLVRSGRQTLNSSK